MTDCNCCDPPNDMVFASANTYCTLHKLTASGATVSRAWGKHHCQDGASKKQPNNTSGPHVTHLRNDGTSIYVGGSGCGLRTTAFSSSGANTFTWPMGVHKITVIAIGGGGDGGSGSSASGGGGGGGWSKKVITRDPDDNAARTDNLSVGAAGEDSWYFNTSTLLAKGGADASGASGGAGGTAAAGIGDSRRSGGDGADADGTSGGGGGSAGGGGPFIAVGSDGNPGVGTEGGLSIRESGPGGDGGESGEDGTNGSAPGGGGGGSGNGSEVPGSGAVGQVIVYYHVYAPIQKWSAAGVLQWEVETRLDGLQGDAATFEVGQGLVVAGTSTLAHGGWLIAINASTGAISWTYSYADLPEILGIIEPQGGDIAIAASGIYAATRDFILRWDTSGNLLNQAKPGDAQVVSGGFPIGSVSVAEHAGGNIVVDGSCNIYVAYNGRVQGNRRGLSAEIVKYAPIETAVENGLACSDSFMYSGVLILDEVGLLPCGYPDESHGGLVLDLSLSPNGSDLYMSYLPSLTQDWIDDGPDPSGTRYCSLYKIDMSDLSLEWGRVVPGLTDANGIHNPRITSISARDDGVLIAVHAFQLSDVPGESIFHNFAASYSSDGTLEYQVGIDDPAGANLSPDVASTGHVEVVTGISTGEFYVGGGPADCTGIYDPDLDEGPTCCDDAELSSVEFSSTGNEIGCGLGRIAAPATYTVPTEVADTFPPFECWELPPGMSQECKDCLETLAGSAITWHHVYRNFGPLGISGQLREYNARVQMQCIGDAGDCGNLHWVELTALYSGGHRGHRSAGSPLPINDIWFITADIHCGDTDAEGEPVMWSCVRPRQNPWAVTTHYGSNIHDHLWFNICCLECDEETPPSCGLCVWQWDAGEGEWNLIRCLPCDRFNCDDAAAPEEDGSEDKEIQCTCPCGDPCTEIIETPSAPSDAVWSLNCPCQTIPKQFTGVLYGLGCFAGEEFTDIEYNWEEDSCSWSGTFVPDPECPEETATHRLTEVEGGWDGVMTWSCASEGNDPRFDSYDAECDPFAITGGGGGYVWDLSEMTCECCEGGGFIVEPPGVPTDCCENELPTTLTATFVDSGGIPCECLVGNQIQLVFTSNPTDPNVLNDPSYQGDGVWEGVFNGCEDDMIFSMYCNGDPGETLLWDLRLSYADVSIIDNAIQDTIDCDLPYFEFPVTILSVPVCPGIGSVLAVVTA